MTQLDFREKLRDLADFLETKEAKEILKVDMNLDDFFRDAHLFFRAILSGAILREQESARKFGEQWANLKKALIANFSGYVNSMGALDFDRCPESIPRIYAECMQHIDRVNDCYLRVLNSPSEPLFIQYPGEPEIPEAESTSESAVQRLMRAIQGDREHKGLLDLLADVSEKKVRNGAIDDLLKIVYNTSEAEFTGEMNAWLDKCLS